MTFTDDDLKRLKERFHSKDPKPWANHLKGLVARLEAAEAIITSPKPDCCMRDLTHIHWNEAVVRWRKTAGK